MKTTVAQFVESLGRSKLLADGEVQTIVGDLTSASQTEDARGLAQSLVQQQKLTPYQATAVYQGKLGGLGIGNYVVLNRIGAGGMGTVFKAEHRVLKRIVAIKVLPRKFLADANAVRRFRREVRAAAQLEHPNIVRAFDADEAGGVHFLVMEYVDGKDLSQYVKRHGRLSVQAALGCILQAARGLEHAHAKGIIHRDVKPANLLLDTTGTVKVLDMGLARLESTADYNESLAQSTLTSPGTVMGTVDYMAPEQALDSKLIDHRADVYSLGYTLFYLLTRKKAYRGDTLMQILMAHQQQPIPSLQKLRPEVPDSLEAVYRKMVAKDRGDRYQSMSACVAALESVLREVAAAQQEANDSRTETLAVPSAEQEARENFQQFLQGLEVDATPTLIMPSPADDAVGAVDAEQQSGVSTDSTIPIKSFTGLLDWAKRRPLPTISAGIALLLLCAVLWSIRGWFGARATSGRTDDQAQAANADSSASGSSVNGEQQGPKWQTLFNGRDLTGWIVVGRGKESWRVENGVLIGQGPQSYLLTERDDYRDFHLRVECRINDGGNSGLFFRAAKGDSSPLEGYEAQIDHGSSEYQTGSLYGIGPEGRISQAPLSGGQWFTHEVIAKGGQIVIKVNGVETFQFEDFGHSYTAGRLGVQLHDDGTVVEVREIEVKEFQSPSRPGEPSPNNQIADNNYALSFDGEDDLINLPDLPAPPPESLTVEGWLSPDHRDGEWPNILVFYGLNVKLLADGKWAAMTKDKGVAVYTPVAAEPGRAAHVAAVISNNELRLYVDGQLRGRSQGEVRLTDQHFISNTGGPFRGRMHEVRISSVPRYTLDFTPKRRFEPDEHTIILYHFDEGSGEVLIDSSGNDRHGKIVGAKWVNADGSPIRPFPGPATLAAWSWSEPVNLGAAVNSAGNDQHPTLSADGLTLIFHGVSKRDGEAGERFQGDRELWICRRQSTDQPWGPAEKLRPPVASSEHDQDPTLSADGLTLVFASERPGGQGMQDLWISRRGSRDEPFGEPEHLDPPINTEHDERGPSLSRDGLWLAFFSNRPGGYGDFDVWLCRRKTVSEPFGAPVNAGPLVNSAAKDRSPSLSNDGLTLLFSSNRPGGVGGQDLWIARRDSVDEPFGEPVNLGPPINTVQREDGPELWADGEYLLFGSQRPDAVGGMDLYISRRIPPPKVTGSLDLKLRQVIKGHASSVRALGLSADGLTLASYDMKEATRVWNLRTGRELAALQHPEFSMGGAHRRLDISYDGGVIATTDESKRIALWDWRTGQTRATPFTADRSFHAAAFSPDGGHLAVASGNRVHLLDAGTLAEVGRTNDYEGNVKFVAFSSDGRLLACGGVGGPIRFHAVPSLEEQFAVSQQFKRDFEAHATAGVFSRDGSLFAASDFYPQITVWDVAAREAVCVVRGISPTGVAISPDNKLLAVAGKVNDEAVGAAIRVWDIATGEQVAQISSGRETWLFGVTFTPDGQSLICNWFNAIHVWDLPAPPTDKPPAAAAPFNANEAKAHQQAWANHLGVPVEYTNSIGMKFRLIPPGEFLMGATDAEIQKWLQDAEQKGYTDPQKFPVQNYFTTNFPHEDPRHRVRITQPFYMGAHEVTVGQFRAFVEEAGYETEAEKDGKGGVTWVTALGTQKPDWNWRRHAFPQDDGHPILQVTWNDADAFCRWLSRKEAAAYSLPSEAQWEYACRAGNAAYWHFGNDPKYLETYAWFRPEGDNRTKPVGGKKPNPFGVFDMYGNVWEWCGDRWSERYYRRSPVDDPPGPAAGESRVARGGSFLVVDPMFARSAHRGKELPSVRNDLLGFRVALALSPPRSVDTR